MPHSRLVLSRVPHSRLVLSREPQFDEDHGAQGRLGREGQAHGDSVGRRAGRPEEGEVGQPATPGTRRTPLAGLAPFARKFAEGERGELVPLPWQPLCHIVTRLAGKEACLKGARRPSIAGFLSRSGKWAPSQARPERPVGGQQERGCEGACCASRRAERRPVAEHPPGLVLKPRRAQGWRAGTGAAPPTRLPLGPRPAPASRRPHPETLHGFPGGRAGLWEGQDCPRVSRDGWQCPWPRPPCACTSEDPTGCPEAKTPGQRGPMTRGSRGGSECRRDRPRRGEKSVCTAPGAAQRPLAFVQTTPGRVGPQGGPREVGPHTPSFTFHASLTPGPQGPPA